MTTQVLSLPIFRAFDSAGLPLAGGLLYTYAAGTTTPLATYSSSDTSTPNANPVVLDSSGTAVVRTTNAAYKFVLKDATGTNTLWSIDNWQGNYLSQSDIISLLGADPIQRQTAAEIAAGVTPTNYGYGTAPYNLLRYGADPTGVADSTVAVTNFLKVLNQAGADGYVPPGTYRTTSSISQALTNVRVFGVPGSSIFTTSTVGTVLQLGATNNVEFYGITFQTTYATASYVIGVVYSLQVNCINTVFRRCTFSSPNAAADGLAILARITNTDATAAAIDGLWIEDCNFTNVGRIGCTLMNRGQGSDRYTNAKRVYFNRNKGNNIGSVFGTGFLLSLDGYGSDFQVDHNSIFNCVVAGIENTGWIDGSISWNVGQGFTGASRFLSLDGTDGSTQWTFTGSVGGATSGTVTIAQPPGQYFITFSDSETRWVTVATNGTSVSWASALSAGSITTATLGYRPLFNNSIIGNSHDATATDHELYSDLQNSLVANNYIKTSADYALLFRRNFYTKFDALTAINTKSTGTYSLLCDTLSSHNRFGSTCVFDDSATGTNFAVVGFVNDASTDNIFEPGVTFNKGTGGVTLQQTTAVGNRIATYVTNGSFTCAAAATTTISDVNVSSSCKILLTPTNAAAATLQGSAKCLYISVKTANTSFQVATANATAAAGTETFDYEIVY